MTTSPITPVDLGNDLLGEEPAKMLTSIVETPHGKRCALTIRTASTTLTVFLPKANVDDWAQNLQKTGDAMTGLVVVRGDAVPAVMTGVPGPR